MVGLYTACLPKLGQIFQRYRDDYNPLEAEPNIENISRNSVRLNGHESKSREIFVIHHEIKTIC